MKVNKWESSDDMEFLVREAKIEDVDAIVELWRELSRGQLSKDPFYEGSLEFNSGYNQLKRSVESEDCGMFVFEREGKIEGFIEVWSKVDNFYFEQDNCAYIVHCLFHKQYQSNQGILHMIISLYRAAEEWAMRSGKQFLTADVFEHNKRVAKVLERFELKPYKTRMVRKI